MAFKLDISDMERHKVEFRLTCKKAQRRFTQAGMLDVYEQILQDFLPNASVHRENRIEINRIDPVEADKLSNFINRLIDLCQNANETELIQDSLRRSIIHARDRQRAGGALIDAMCLFCMGLFSMPQIQAPPTELFSSTPRYIRRTDEHSRMDFTAEDNLLNGEPEPRPIESELHLDRDYVHTDTGGQDGAQASGPQQGSARPEARANQARAQQAHEYRPQFNVPPTPDEDANIDGNQDNEPSATGHLSEADGEPNGNVHEDSLHKLFESDHPSLVSQPLEDFIESQRTALNMAEAHAYDNQSDHHSYCQQSFATAGPFLDPIKTSASAQKKVLVSSANIEREIANASMLLDQNLDGPSMHRSQPVSSLDRQIQDSIGRCQLNSMSMTQATQVQLVNGLNRSGKERLSKQFVKKTARGRKKTTKIGPASSRK